MTSDLPEWWHWESGGTIRYQTTEKGKGEVTKHVDVDELIRRRSDLVARGEMTVSEWLTIARDAWIRDHPDMNLSQ